MKKIITILTLLLVSLSAFAASNVKPHYTCETGILSRAGQSYFCVSEVTLSCEEGLILALSDDRSGQLCFRANSSNRQFGINPRNECLIGNIASTSNGSVCISRPIDDSPTEEVAF